jgi:low temperature requirement protein LtrA
MTQLRRLMRARPIDEVGRVSTPLELIFDLTFVVAISLLVNEVATELVHGNGWIIIPRFLMVFFAIWWAWNQFTWLASAYDTDDIPYRLLTMVQMAGVLVLASGVPAAFNYDNWTVVTIGYFIMRLGLVVSISRAVRDDTETGRVAMRYVIGISVLQVFWLLRLLLPPGHGAINISFLVLAIAELLVPLWADRAGGINFHPGHLVDRHGSFMLILLGESVLAATTAFRDVLANVDLDIMLVATGLTALVILFALWWIYFEQPSAKRLEANRRRAFTFAYGHYVVFAALALVGAGLELVVNDVSGHAPVAGVVAAGAIGWPTAIFILSLWAVHVPLAGIRSADSAATWLIAILVAAVPFTATWIGTLWCTVAIALLLVALVVWVLVQNQRAARAGDESRLDVAVTEGEA